MELPPVCLNVLLKADKYIALMIQTIGLWSYGILFAVIFCATGLVVTLFLPGDLLLFAVGTFAVIGSLDLFTVTACMTMAAIAGDTVNYWIGGYLGPKVFHGEGSRYLNKKHLERTHEFYEKYGGKTIIIARFVPVTRTFAPFVAGIGSMHYGRFIVYNIAGGILWITSLTLAGYYFGTIPIVKKYFILAIMVIIAISILPGIIEVLLQWKKNRLSNKNRK